MLIVVNKGEQTIGIVDPVAGKQIADIPTNGDKPHEAAVSPDGKTAYVPIYGNSGVGKPGTNGRNIVVIDLASQKVTGNIEFTHGVRPHCAVFDAKHDLLYVTTELDHTISIIDPRTLKIVGAVPTGQAESHMLAISSDGNRGYTANVGPGTVSVLDMRKRKTIAVIPISHNTQRISISPDDSMVFTSDQTKPQLAVIDTSTKKIKTWVPLLSLGYGTAPTRDGRWLLVAMPAADQVAVVDLNELKVAHNIKVCGSPQEVHVQPDNPAIAYVSCASTHNVGVLNLLNWTMQSTIDVGEGPDGLAWAK
jgi:DNA-binding beta-propeller fold protein YncE